MFSSTYFLVSVNTDDVKRVPETGRAKDPKIKVEIDILELQFFSTVLLWVKVDYVLPCERVHVRHCLCTVPAMY